MTLIVQDNFTAIPTLLLATTSRRRVHQVRVPMLTALAIVDTLLISHAISSGGG